jgi:hypothetical protein
VERLLDAAGTEATPERAQGLAAAAALAFRQGDNDVTKQRAQQALDVARAVDRHDVEAEALLVLARAGLRDGDPGAVRLRASEARRIALELGDEDRELSAIHHLAEGARMAGDLDEARTLYAESLERNRARGAQLLVAVELSNFGCVEKASGRLDVAEARMREAIPISLSIGNSYILAHSLVALAAIVAAGSRANESARLLGKADAIFAETGLVLDPADKPEYDGAVAVARAALSDEAYEAAYAAGVNLDPATAVARAQAPRVNRHSEERVRRGSGLRTAKFRTDHRRERGLIRASQGSRRSSNRPRHPRTGSRSWLVPGKGTSTSERTICAMLILQGGRERLSSPLSVKAIPTHLLQRR